ncbi:Ig-like domain-containing protein [Verrucomicrobia bacterium]|nr:Ig-like domain-containing protein [Verrucomicrobiota bacterium]
MSIIDKNRLRRGLAMVLGLVITSSASLLIQAQSDGELPSITGATGSVTFDKVKVTFSEPVDPASGGVAGNYALSDLTISGATVGEAPNDHIVTLNTSDQGEGSIHTLTVNNVKDLDGNTIAADSSREFSTLVWQEGAVLHKFWSDLTPNNIEALQADPRFPDAPTMVTLEPMWEYGPDGSNESGSSYGNMLVGWFVPPKDGLYIFFTNSDDPSDLFLSTDDDPANKLLIARESGWSNARSWVSVGGGSNVDDKRSDGFFDSEWPTYDIELEGGKRYYLESIHTEGGGGDSVAATVVGSLDPDPADGDAPTLTGSLIGTYVDPNNASITVSKHPASRDVTEGTGTVLSIAASGTSAYGPNVLAWKWQQAAAGSSDFTDIEGETEETYETPVLATADNGIQYRVVFTVPSLEVISEVATISVVADTTPAKVSTVAAKSTNALVVRFDEGVDATSGSVAGNYSLSDGVSVTSASANGSNTVLLDTSDLVPSSEYTLAVTNVKDLYGNAIDNASYTFIVEIVTYGEIIQSDGPIAYYRFNEESGQVATNYGSLGTDADGLWMSGNGPDDSVEVDLVNEEGPSPTNGFLGFGLDNRAASFNGDLDALWVDAQGQWLDNLDSFTLEYWVKPTNREGGGWNRVGIVGQNDAVEYGFINGDTIQIWTPGGGALNTPYEFQDDEWHHIATIADGNQIHNYFDGELVGSAGTKTSNYGSANYNVHIGGGGVYDGSGNHFEGALDEVAIFDKAIPADRVKEHYTAGIEGGTKAPSEGGGGGGGDGGGDGGAATLVASSDAALSAPEVVDFGALDGSASFEFHFTAIKAGASTAIAGNNAFAIKLDQWNEQGLFGTTQFGVADNLFEGSNVESVFDVPVHVVITSDADAGESLLYIDGALAGDWAGNIALSGDTKVMGARLEQETDHMGEGSVMHAWATYSGTLTAAEISSKFEALPDLSTGGGGGDGGVEATFHAIDQAYVTTEDSDLWALSNLIQGPGVGFNASAPYEKIIGGADGNWVTDAPGGYPADYIEVAGAPVIDLDLGADVALGEISIWGYDDGNANGVSEVSLRFATDAEGFAGYGQSITYNPTFTLTQGIATERQSSLFSETVTARYVEVTVVDNFYLAPGDGSEGGKAGGDRVGLGEIALQSNVSDTAGGGGAAISSVTLSDGAIVIEYTGTLKTSSTVNGDYSDVAGASSPYSVAADQEQSFFMAD